MKRMMDTSEGMRIKLNVCILNFDKCQQPLQRNVLFFTKAINITWDSNAIQCRKYYYFWNSWVYGDTVSHTHGNNNRPEKTNKRIVLQILNRWFGLFLHVECMQQWPNLGWISFFLNKLMMMIWKCERCICCKWFYVSIKMH